MRILEEFWYGNIEPTEYDTSSCKEYKKLLELICRNEEKLKATMTDEQKELFEKYTDRFSLPEQQLPLRLQNSQHTVCCGCQAELRAPWCGLHDEVQDSGSDCC